MYNSTEQFVLDKQFNLLEEKFDEVIVEGITPEKVGVLLKEAFNSEPYSLKELQIKGSEVNYIFADENDEDFRLQFIGAGGAFGKNTDSVYIGKRRGNSKVFVDSIDKLSNPARIVSSMITYLNDYLLNKGKSKVGFAINLSGKAGVRFAPFLKKLIDRTLRSKLKVVKGNYDPINGRKFVWAYDSTKKPEEVFNGKKITDEAPWFKRDEIEDKATDGGVKQPVSNAVLKEINKYLQNEINKQIKKSGSTVGVTTSIVEPVASPSDKEKFSVLIVSKFDGGLVKSYPSIYQSSMDTSNQTYILGDVSRIVDLSLELHKKAKKTLDYTPAVNTRTEEITSDDSNKRFGTLGYVTNDMGSSLKVGETLNWFSFYSGKPEKFEVIAKTPEHVDLKSDISGKYFRYSISMWNPDSDQKDLVGKAPQDKGGHTAPGLKPQEIETPEPQTGFNSEIALEYKELKSMSLSSLKNEIKRTNKIVDLSGYDKEGAISDILEARFGRKKVVSHFKAVDMSSEPPESKMDSKGQMKPFSISNLPPIVKGLLKAGIKTFTNTSTHPSNPDVHNWYFDTVGSTGKVTTEDNDSKFAALSLEDKAIKSIETTIAFKFIPSLDPVDVIKAALDKTKVLVCGTTSQRDKMSLLSGLPKRSTNFTKTAKAIETYIQSRFKEAGIVAKIVPSGSGLNIASVYIDDKFFHIALDYRMTDKLTTEIRSLNPAVKIVHEDKIYDTPEQAHQAVFVKSIDKLVELISKGYTSVDEQPDISDNYSIEDAVASKDPSILGAKGLWMRGLLLNEAIEDAGFTFRWGMPKTGEMKTFISKGFVRNGKTLNAETAKGEVALFKVVGVDPKVTPAGFNSDYNDFTEKEAIKSRDPEILGFKGIFLDGVGSVSLDSILQGEKFTWGVPKTYGLKELSVTDSGISTLYVKDKSGNKYVLQVVRKSDTIHKEIEQDSKIEKYSDYNISIDSKDKEKINEFVDKVNTSSFVNDLISKNKLMMEVEFFVGGDKFTCSVEPNFVPFRSINFIHNNGSIEVNKDFKVINAAGIFSGLRDFEIRGVTLRGIATDKPSKRLLSIFKVNNVGEANFASNTNDAMVGNSQSGSKKPLTINYTDGLGATNTIHYSASERRVWMTNPNGATRPVSKLMFKRTDIKGGDSKLKEFFVDGVLNSDPQTDADLLDVVKNITILDNELSLSGISNKAKQTNISDNIVEISAKEFLTMLREYPAFSTLLDGGDVYGGSDNGEYNYELETLYGPSTIDIKIVGSELQAIMRDDEGSVMGKAKHTNISDIKVSMDSIISSLDNTVEEFFGDTFDAVHKETSVQQGKQDKFGFKIPTQTSHSKSSTGIGDIVRLKTPINGIMYASVSGFGLAKGSRLVGGAPAPGSKVSVLKAKLKVTPLFRVDYLGDVEIEKGQYITVDNSKENKLWRELNPDYSEKLDKLGIN